MSNTTFRDKRPGQRVSFLIPSGFGRYGQEYSRKSGRIVFAFSTHLVVNGGGRYGTPYVVDDNNFLAK